MLIATREKRKDGGFHDGLRRAPDRQGPRSQKAKIRRKEVDPATERSGKGQAHGLGTLFEDSPCRMPKSGSPPPVSEETLGKKGRMIMGFVKRDEIRGVSLDDGRIFCAEHMGDLSEYKESDFIMDSDIENTDDLYYCDECKENL
jgi:hypothetical protein